MGKSTNHSLPKSFPAGQYPPYSQESFSRIGRLQSLRQKNDPASLSEKRTASHAYLPLYRLSHRQQPPGSGRTSYPPWSAGVFKNYKANPDAVLSKSDTLIKSLEEVVQKHQNVLKALSCQKTRQYELLEQGNYTMDVFLERSESSCPTNRRLRCRSF